MNIRLFIVTYNNSIELNNTLDVLFFNNHSIKNNLEVYIINNHSNFSINEKYKYSTKVLHNVLRPDFSTGYLSRNWNQSLILGFENLNNPKSDIVIACQDDTHFYPDWLDKLLELHKKYSFITYGWGDNFMSWTPEGVKNIGLWDERFIFSGVTSDYFLRALLFNKKNSSINDYYHKRVLNEEKIKIADRPHNIKIHLDERKNHKDYGHKIFHHKWNNVKGYGVNWDKEMIENCSAEIKSPQYILYPFFEKDINYTKQKVML